MAYVETSLGGDSSNVFALFGRSVTYTDTPFPKSPRALPIL